MAHAAIKFFLNVCSDLSDVTVNGESFPGGHKGEITIEHTVHKGILEFSVLERTIKLGGVDHMVGVSLRVCKTSASVIAVYDEPEKNLDGCCACCGSCCVYGDSFCSCQQN